MEEISKFELNNSILKDFDKLMSFHLDQIEELDINETLLNTKLYNIIGLCTNLKTLSIVGDLRTDVNKILFSICNPERLETLILNSVKLPTTKSFVKFTNIKTISLDNITFCDVKDFFSRITNKENVIALNLTNVDLGKNPISICKDFSKLKYFNLDNLRNCKFDDFEFIYENKKMERFEFFNNEVEFSNLNTFCKGKYTKNIQVCVKSAKECEIRNEFKIDNEEKISILVNSCDLDDMIENVTLQKIDDLTIILNEDIELDEYVKKLKKVKGTVTFAIRNISYLRTETAKNLKEKLNINSIIVLNDEDLNIEEAKQCYSIDKYIKTREYFDEILDAVDSNRNDIEKFDKTYTYFKDNIEYDEDIEQISEAIIKKKCSYNLYAIILRSVFYEINVECKLISGAVDGDWGYKWNQIKLNDIWFNMDFAYEFRAKSTKEKLPNMYKDNLFSDEQFDRNHFAKTIDIAECFTEASEVKKDFKRSLKKASVFNRIVYKLKSVFKMNKKELPAPMKVGKHAKDVKD